MSHAPIMDDPGLADADADLGAAMVDRHGRMLRELAEIGMVVARALGRQVARLAIRNAVPAASR